MAWIKRNLILVISGVVALVLLGLGGYYLYSANQKNQQIDTDIESTKAEIRRLFEKPVTPTADNLKLAKQEAVKLNSFVSEAKKMFPSTPAPSEPLNSPSFKSLLANIIADLHRQAGTVPTRLETNPSGPYYFTFESQRLALNLPPESLRPLYERLHEVQFVAQSLFKSRINRLVSLKRAAVIGERPSGGGGMAPGGGNDYLTASVRIDQETGMALWPYEVVFDCFTPELAAVVEGLQGGKYGVLIKTVEVRPADELPTAPGGRGQPGQNQPPGQPPQRGMRGNAPGARGAPAPAVAPGPGSPQLVTIINERLIRVTLNLDIIKPDSGGAGGPGGFPGGGRRGGGGGPGGGGRGGPGGGPGGAQ
jgi:hypothetical protein